MSIFLSLFGSVKVNLTGKEISRFLRLCSTYRIFLFDISSEGADEISFFMSARDVFRLRPVLRKTGCRLRICQRRGAPFFFLRYRWKIAFRGSILCAFLLFWYLTGFIWSVHLSGNSYLTEEYMRAFLEERQAYIGCRAGRIDTVALEEQILEAFPEVIWTSVYIKGTSLHITLKEQIRLAEEQEERPGVQDLIAPADGKVAEIFVRSGTAAVAQGDEVKKGDVLIHGWVPVYDDMETLVKHYDPVAADGDVLIERRQPYREQLDAAYQKKQWTETLRYVTFETAGVNADLIRYFLPDEKRVVFCETRPLRLFHSIVLPLTQNRYEARLYRLKPQTYSRSEAEEILLRRYRQFAKKIGKKGVQITDKNVIILRKGNVYSMEGDVLLRYPAKELRAGTVPDVE